MEIEREDEEGDDEQRKGSQATIIRKCTCARICYMITYHCKTRRGMNSVIHTQVINNDRADNHEALNHELPAGLGLDSLPLKVKAAQS